MKFSGKMWLMIILKVTKNQGFTISVEDTFFEKPQRGVKLTPFPPAVLGLNKSFGRIIFHKIYFAKHGISMMKGSKHKDS